MLKKRLPYEGFNLEGYAFKFETENLEDLEISEHDPDPILNLRDRLNQENDYTQNSKTWIK